MNRFLVLVIVSVAMGSLLSGARAAGQRREGQAQPFSSAVSFLNIARAAGIDFVHVNGASPEKYLVETMGSGGLFLDFDNDGWLDILTVNGKVALEGRANGKFPYDQRKQLFRNLGDRRFQDVTDQAGKVFTLSDVGRGAAFGDIDNDGDTDVVVANNSGPVRLLINNLGNRNHWLGLRLVGERRDMLGATVAVMRRGNPTLWRRARADGSYASANDPRVLVGLGRSTEKPRLRVRWPDGRTEEWNDVPIDRYTTLTEGKGNKRQ